MISPENSNVIQFVPRANKPPQLNPLEVSPYNDSGDTPYPDHDPSDSSTIARTPTEATVLGQAAALKAAKRYSEGVTFSTNRPPKVAKTSIVPPAPLVSQQEDLADVLREENAAKISAALVEKTPYGIQRTSPKGTIEVEDTEPSSVRAIFKAIKRVVKSE